MKPRAIHQLSISAARGDAIGNERDGLATESVVESLSPNLRDIGVAA